MAKGMSNEEVAAKLVQIYFKEIARLGHKRRLTLDETINAYYYTLSKIQNKSQGMNQVKNEVIEDEQELKTETKDELFPQVTETITKTTTETTKKENPFE